MKNGLKRILIIHQNFNKMDKISDQRLRLLCEVITQDFCKTYKKKPSVLYLQYKLYDIFGLHVAKSEIINLESFKQIANWKKKVKKIVKKQLRH